MTEHLSNFISSPLITKARLCEIIFGKANRDFTSRFSKLMKSGEFTPEQIQKLEAARAEHVRAITPIN